LFWNLSTRTARYFKCGRFLLWSMKLRGEKKPNTSGTMAKWNLKRLAIIFTTSAFFELIPQDKRVWNDQLSHALFSLQTHNERQIKIKTVVLISVARAIFYEIKFFGYFDVVEHFLLEKNWMGNSLFFLAKQTRPPELAFCAFDAFHDSLSFCAERQRQNCFVNFFHLNTWDLCWNACIFPRGCVSCERVLETRAGKKWFYLSDDFDEVFLEVKKRAS